MTAKLNKKEQAWVNKLQKVLDECPKSLSDRAQSYTIGDNDVTIFDENIYDDTGRDVCEDVRDSEAELEKVYFPFCVWSTCG